MNSNKTFSPQAPILQVKNLVKSFGGLRATDQANLSIELGTIHALIGPNGAGKTTLIQQISGALKPDTGEIIFDGLEITNIPMYKRVKLGLARSYQITNIFTRLSVLDNINLALMSISGKGLGLWQAARGDSQRYYESVEIARRVGLGPSNNTVAGALSHGEQRKLELAITLATRPKLLLLDEPMAGLGPDESEQMVQLLKSLAPEISILLIEHDMDAVFRLADTISALVFGKIIATGTEKQIKENPDVRKAYLGDGLDEFS